MNVFANHCDALKYRDAILQVFDGDCDEFDAVVENFLHPFHVNVEQVDVCMHVDELLYILLEF